MTGRSLRQLGPAFVSLRVVLHRTTAERIEVTVNAHVQSRQVDEMSHDIGLSNLRQRQRRRGEKFRFDRREGCDFRNITFGNTTVPRPDETSQRSIVWLLCYACVVVARENTNEIKTTELSLRSKQTRAIAPSNFFVRSLLASCSSQSGASSSCRLTKQDQCQTRYSLAMSSPQSSHYRRKDQAPNALGPCMLLEPAST